MMTELCYNPQYLLNLRVLHVLHIPFAFASLLFSRGIQGRTEECTLWGIDRVLYGAERRIPHGTHWSIPRAHLEFKAGSNRGSGWIDA